MYIYFNTYFYFIAHFYNISTSNSLDCGLPRLNYYLTILFINALLRALKYILSQR